MEDVFHLRFVWMVSFIGEGLTFNIESLRVVKQTCVVFSFTLFTQKILYSFCSPHDVREAVLQQEVSGN